MTDEKHVSQSLSFAPRSASVAKRLVFVLTGAATVVTVVTAVLAPAPHTGTWGSLAVLAPVVILALAIVIVVVPEPPLWAWTAFPFSTTVAIAVADLATRDASVTAQIFFFFPVLYAGAQLRRRAAALLCSVTLVAAAVVLCCVLEPRTAAVDLLYLVGALSATAAMLVYSGEHAERLLAQLAEQAAIDPLTGLVTRRVLDAAASSALQSAARDGGTALILVDIDHFKSVNDVHGHPVGDLVLQQVSAVLQHSGRHTDVTCRMGGDEFALLLPGCSYAAALRRAQAVLCDIRGLRLDVEYLTMADQAGDLEALTVTASIGVAHLPTHAADVHELYRTADLRLYSAKRAGRNRVGVADTHQLEAS